VALTSCANDDMRDRVEIREGTLTYRVQDTARSIGRALKLAEGGKLGRRGRFALPIDPEAFLVPGEPGRIEVA
jgi:hypothetical protein